MEKHPKRSYQANMNFTGYFRRLDFFFSIKMALNLHKSINNGHLPPFPIHPQG